MCSLGGVAPPSTPASSAFLFPLLELEAVRATGGVAGTRNTDTGGSVNDFWFRKGEIGDASGVGAVNEREGGIRKDVEGAPETG